MSTATTVRRMPPNHKGRKFPPDPIRKDEVRAMLSAASSRYSSGIRMRALIGVLFGAGLRISEALSLLPRDLDLDRCQIRVLKAKGGKSRLVGLDPYAAGLVAAWMARRKLLGLNGRHPVFAAYTVGKVGTPLGDRYVRKALAALADKAGVERRVTPHQFRHGMSFDLAMSGVPTHVIQAQLGHSTLAVTDRYISHLAPADVVSVMAAREWGCDDDHPV